MSRIVLQLGLAIALALDGVRVEAERDVVDEHPAVDLGEVDAPLAAVAERVERADDIVAIDAEVECEVVAGAGRDARRRATPCSAAIDATIAWEPSPPAIAERIGAVGDRPGRARVARGPTAGPSSIGSMPTRAGLVGELEVVLATLPPPDFGLKKSTGWAGSAARGSGTWIEKSALVAAKVASAAAPITTSSSTRRVGDDDHHGREREHRRRDQPHDPPRFRAQQFRA